jgi:hypothetical protein
MPLRIYRLEHEKRSGWTPEGEALLTQRMATTGSCDSTRAYMRWLKRPMIFNGSDWGFGDVVLSENMLQVTSTAAEAGGTSSAAAI